jgi:hypothetical protein
LCVIYYILYIIDYRLYIIDYILIIYVPNKFKLPLFFPSVTLV